MQDQFQFLWFYRCNDDKKENKSEDSDTVRANTVTTDVVGGEKAQEINEENKSVTLQQKLTETED